MSSLVRVLTNTGKSVKHFTVDALTGKYYERLLRVPGIKNLEVSDPDLESNLTEDELRRMREKFPYLAPKERKPEPLPLPLGEMVIFNPTIEPVEAVISIATSSDNLPASDVELTVAFGIPPESVTEDQPQAVKRGRKPKQA